MALKKTATGWMLRQKEGIRPFKSSDPDSERIWWQDAGVNQNLAFPVHPDPVSGMHAWHQRVRLGPAEAGDPVPRNNSATDADPPPLLFADDFETGDSSAWSLTVP